ncbi:MAG: hypothetical protein JXA89_26525 [Anaerolineae bacterium]|nr:hypothetical protein [Anaerolineae bacterium]
MTESARPRFCGQCGAPLHADARFCGMCGRPVQPATGVPPAQSQASPQQVAPPQVAPFSQQVAAQPYAAPSEPILGIVPGLQRQRGFLGFKAEAFNLIATPHRLVLAFVPQKMMNEAITIARNEAKAEGKGMLGQVVAQMGWLNVICRQYQNMPIDAILAQAPGSFSIPLATIRRVRLNNRIDQDNNTSRQELVIESTGGKSKFNLVGTSTGEARRTLKQVLGDVAR